MTENTQLTQPILMIAKDDTWQSDYIVNATTRIEAAEILAKRLRRSLDEVKELYRPIELSEVTVCE